MSRKITPHRLANELIADGWKSPNAHASHYADLPDEPGVYLFTYSEIDNPKVKMRVVYAGMSCNLKRRHYNHPTRALIAKEAPTFGHIQCWFKALPACEIAEAEIELIKKYDPSFNIIHRRRKL